MIRLENVTYRYRNDSEPVIRNLNLTVRDGECLSVMGANGSGKSTLAKILAGLIEVKLGRIHIDNSHATRMPVGILFQNPDNQMVAVIVEKEIAFALENFGVPQQEMERLITETLKRFSISHLRRRLTSELSGGEKQRVALASVMVSTPRVLVLDEPDSFLDECGKTVLLEELLKLRQENPSMIQIHITQYPNTAQLYPRLVVLDRGTVAADASPSEVFQDMEFCIKTGLGFSLTGNRQLAIPMFEQTEKASESALIQRIRFRNVCFEYLDKRTVLRNLSFTLDRGEIIGLVGPSGSGKSTVGLLMCGLLESASGVIEYVDDTNRILPPGRQIGHVSAVFQQPERQFFLPTCSKEIAFGPENLGRHLTVTDVDSMLALVGLEPKTFASKDPFTLSGGEKRRLACAAVLSMFPQFVVFDEPTCGLDQEGGGRFILLTQALKQRGIGMVIITHDGDLIRTLADKVVHLKGDSRYVELTKADFFQNDAWVGVVSQPSDRKEIYEGQS
jgi:energy-coupling factor transporter ATP-binding protein EcfA2